MGFALEGACLDVIESTHSFNISLLSVNCVRCHNDCTGASASSLPVKLQNLK